MRRKEEIYILKKRMLCRKENKERINAHQLKKDYKRANRRGRWYEKKRAKERKLERGMNREMPRRVKPGVCSREGTRESRKEREGKKGGERRIISVTPNRGDWQVNTQRGRKYERTRDGVRGRT